MVRRASATPPVMSPREDLPYRRRRLTAIRRMTMVTTLW